MERKVQLQFFFHHYFSVLQISKWRMRFKVSDSAKCVSKILFDRCEHSNSQDQYLLN
jgi:hypothetical protein